MIPQVEIEGRMASPRISKTDGISDDVGKNLKNHVIEQFNQTKNNIGLLKITKLCLSQSRMFASHGLLKGLFK